jgi:alpha-tubulin suppressor-like RCC1 family protein
MTRRALLLAALTASGCMSSPVRDDCQVHCGAGGACPEDHACGDDAFCHPSSAETPRDCAAVAGDPDGGGGDLPCEAIAVEASTNHTCAVRLDGRLVCWGESCNGQLGAARPEDTDACDGDVANVLAPIEVERDGSAIEGVTDVRVGLLHTCALAGGDLLCWGDDRDGQLGRGTTGGETADPAPVEPDGPALGALAHLATGWFHGCATAPDGDAWCWGNNSNGLVGVDDWSGALDDRPLASAVDTGDSLAAIAAGATHSCAVTGDGGARCWGRNQAGQLGSSPEEDPTAQPTPVVVLRETDEMPLDGVTAIGAGNNISCAATASPDEVWCWGANLRHSLGDDSTPEELDGDPAWLARRAELDPIAPVSQVSVGGKNACALTGGDLWCWGANDEGQIGVGSGEPWLPPTLVRSGVIDVGVGFGHICAVVEGGAVECWGANDAGQLGTGDTRSVDEPTAVEDLCP